MPRLKNRPVRATEAPPAPSQGRAGTGRRTPLLGLPLDLPADTPVTCDTETSGFHFDDGATVSVVSVAWRDQAGVIQDRAYPFDQERYADKGLAIGGKPMGAKGAKKAGDGALELFGLDALAEVEDDPNLGENEWWELLNWLADQWLVFHNAKFDLHHLRNGTRHWPGRDLVAAFRWDTMLVCGPLWPGQGAQLKPTMERLYGEDERAEQQALAPYLKTGPTGKRYDLVPWDVMSAYATKDANQTLRLYETQIAFLDGRNPKWGKPQVAAGRGLNRPEKDGLVVTQDLTRTLYQLERRGMPYDADRSREIAREVEAARQEPMAELREMWGEEPTAAIAKEWFYGHGAKPVWDEKSQSMVQSVDVVQTRDWIRDGLPGAEQWRRMVQLGQANSMYYDGYANLTGKDGNLRTDFKLATVRSGRLSVGRVQLQAIPKMDKALGLDGVPHVRELFFEGPAKREGYVPYNLDLSQAELRVATQLSGCWKMREMLEGGADLHSITTESVFGMTPGNTDKATFKSYRDIAKRLTFGSIFLIGPKAFRAALKKYADVDWSLDQCTEAIQGWRRTYPEFKRAYYQAMDYATQHKHVELVSGRKSWLNGPRDYPSAAWNRTVQASLSDFVVRWLAKVEEATRAYDGLVLTVHDSAVLYLPAEVGPELCKQIAEDGAATATAEFGITMKIDSGLWRE